MMEEDYTYVLQGNERDYGPVVLDSTKNLMKCS